MDEKMEIRLVNPTEDGFLQKIDWNKAELEENVRSIVAAYQGFCKIMEYRSVDINANMTKEQRDFYRRKKELYALPLPADEEEKVDAIAEALMNGGDLTGLL